jgi:hypothetical protein
MSDNCTVCRRDGARWLMRVDEKRHIVHKQCADRAREQAPKGVVVKIYPSEELRREWDARAFWKDKFQKAGVDVTSLANSESSLA